MRSEIIPEGDEFRHPLFVSPLPFLYRIVYRDRQSGDSTLTYGTPHEIILNLHCFRDDDKITYINRDNNQEIFTITVDRFKVMLAESIYNVSHDELEPKSLVKIIRLYPDESVQNVGFHSPINHFQISANN